MIQICVIVCFEQDGEVVLSPSSGEKLGHKLSTTRNPHVAFNHTLTILGLYLGGNGEKKTQLCLLMRM